MYFQIGYILLINLYIYAEWEQSSGRVLSLRDDDSQSLIDGEWRRINTLSYYKVIKVLTSVLLFQVSAFYMDRLQYDQLLSFIR